MLSLCVTGDGLAGKTQRIAFTPASSYQASVARLQSSLQFDAPGATIKSVALWDKDFEEYVRIDSFDGLDVKAKIRVELNSSKELVPEMQAVLAVSEAAVTRLVESIGGASAVAALAQIQQATREAMVTGDVAALSRAVAKAEAEAAVSTTPRETGRSAPRKASNPSSAASAAAEANPTPKRKKAAAPTELTPEAARVPRRFVVSPQANSPLKQMVARASSPVTRLTAGEQSMMTLFCVYNGSMSQRAKAIRINRDRPDWTAVLATLQAKFGCELALGYVENGSDAVVEILDGNHLADIIRSDCRDADSLTLQCWRPDGFGDYEGMDADQLQVAVQNARPGSALRGSVAMDSIRRPPSTKGVGEKLDVSGALYNDEQLQALFDQIDIDGSGYLDIDEFRSFFKNQYDGMGINDVDAKFEKLLASTTAFEDGKLDFDEFAIIMLKISQW